MKAILRASLRIACVVCVGVVLVLLGLRAYCGVGAVVGMVPLGEERGVLLASKYGGYCEVIWVERWPGARWGVWAGSGWRDVGPFMSWWRTNGFSVSKFQYRLGTAMVPRVSAGGAVAYEHAYTRAEQLGYPRTFARPPESAVIDGWYFQFPHGAAICAVGLLPAGWLIVWLRRSRGTVRAARRRQAGLCAACGYDLRASAGVCPECGREVEVVVARDWPGWLRGVERISLGLFVATALLWVASHVFDVARHQHKQQVIGNIVALRWSEYALQRGGLSGNWVSSTLPIRQPAPAAFLATVEKYRGPEGVTETSWTRTPLSRQPRLGVFGELSADGSPGNRRVLLGVRLATLSVLFAILPALRLWVGGWPPLKRVGAANNCANVESGSAQPTRAT